MSLHHPNSLRIPKQRIRIHLLDRQQLTIPLKPIIKIDRLLCSEIRIDIIQIGGEIIGFDRCDGESQVIIEDCYVRRVRESVVGVVAVILQSVY